MKRFITNLVLIILAVLLMILLDKLGIRMPKWDELDDTTKIILLW